MGIAACTPKNTQLAGVIGPAFLGSHRLPSRSAGVVPLTQTGVGAGLLQPIPAASEEDESPAYDPGCAALYIESKGGRFSEPASCIHTGVLIYVCF